MEVRETARGWVVDVTHTIHGCLEQGGWSDRRVLVYYDSMDFGRGELDKVRNDCGTTNREALLAYVRDTDWTGDKLLRRGHRIQ